MQPNFIPVTPALSMPPSTGGSTTTLQGGHSPYRVHGGVHMPQGLWHGAPVVNLHPGIGLIFSVPECSQDLGWPSLRSELALDGASWFVAIDNNRLRDFIVHLYEPPGTGSPSPAGNGGMYQASLDPQYYRQMKPGTPLSVPMQATCFGNQLVSGPICLPARFLGAQELHGTAPGIQVTLQAHWAPVREDEPSAVWITQLPCGTHASPWGAGSHIVAETEYDTVRVGMFKTLQVFSFRLVPGEHPSQALMTAPDARYLDDPAQQGR